MPNRIKSSLSRVALVVCAASCVACSEPPEPPVTQRAVVAAALKRLRGRERALVSAAAPTVPAPFAPWLGPDPYRLCAVGAHHWVALLRGSSELVLSDATLLPLARIAVPGRPVACVGDGERVTVLSRAPAQLVFYEFAAGTLRLEHTLALPEAEAPTALAARAERVWVADAPSGALFTADRRERRVERALPTSLCRFPHQLRVVGSRLIAACLWDHAIVVRSLATTGEVGDEVARIVHDGPWWALDAQAAPNGGLLIAATGVEDRPLERFGGAFGYVDSFAFLYEIRASGVARRFAENLSERSVVVPKAVALRVSADSTVHLDIAAFGSDRRVSFELDADYRIVSERAQASVPGVSDWISWQGRWLAVSPLLDAFVELGEARPRVVPAPSPRPLPPLAQRLGEALAFTDLMGTGASSEGRHSRFSCETCHFEGGVDGRVHHTGRGDVRVSTKPLRGLLRNAPHFSRALDPDLTSVSHNEFRVVSLGNDFSPWFSLDTGQHAWLSALGVQASVLGPEELRAALLEFLAAFEPEQNSRTLRRSAFDADERRGALEFAAHCERCHAARSVAQDSSSRVPFEAWQSRIFEPSGRLIWARGDYEKTGVLPYVHPNGTRIPALRRITQKFPYFTNGSAGSLETVLSQARFTDQSFFHAAAPATAFSLSLDQQRALVAFLRLL